MLLRWPRRGVRLDAQRIGAQLREARKPGVDVFELEELVTSDAAPLDERSE